MSDYRLLIADADASYAEYLAQSMKRKNRLKVVGCAHDGVRALQKIQSSRPDIILMDPLLPEMDGLSVLKAVHKMRFSPIVVCISRFHTSTSIEVARKYGACYYVYKPVDVDSLSAILVECADTIRESQRMHRADEETARHDELHRRIHAILHELGFSSKHNGSGYIADSVALAAESPMMLHNLSSGLYRQLAARAKVSEACVERSIRTAIASANVDGRLSAAIGAAPTNKSCIRYILQTLNLHQ